MRLTRTALPLSNETAGMTRCRKQGKKRIMPLVDIQLIQGVFDETQKREMIEKVTDIMVAIEGEAMRGVTWVRVQQVASGS